MHCPKCNSSNYELLDYEEDFINDNTSIHAWEICCNECGYRGRYVAFYNYDHDEWEDLENNGY